VGWNSLNGERVRGYFSRMMMLIHSEEEDMNALLMDISIDWIYRWID
jgi:hypothetical protein